MKKSIVYVVLFLLSLSCSWTWAQNSTSDAIPVSDSTLTQLTKPPATPVSLQTYPVVTPSLTPGKVHTRQFSVPKHMAAFFVIGDDAASQRWLKAHAQSLSQQHALGFVVNVNSAMRLKQLKALAPQVALLPLSGEPLHEAYALSHYPALITREGIHG